MSDNSHFFLAIDAGGTKADFLLAQGEKELARVRVDSIKVLTTPPESAEVNFRTALRELEKASGVSALSVSRTCVGASGLSVPSVAAWIREQHGRQVGGKLDLCGDEEIAFHAAFGDARGVLALAGTGSNVVGRTADGAWVRAGGWGPVLGDEGSGHWIGLEAVRAIFHAIDEEEPTTLERNVLEKWGLASREQLIEQGNTAGQAKFAELTRVVMHCAGEGDQTAAGVLRRAGEEVAQRVATVVRRMHTMETREFSAPEVATCGSILASVPAVGEAMAAALRRSWPGIRVRAEVADPVLGALWRARAAAEK
jgi:glucosamine kinase